MYQHLFYKSKPQLILRICSLLMAINFILPHVIWAFDAGNYILSQPHFLKINHLGKALTIPEKMGTIHNGFQGSRKTVVSIQDLHCNYEVQKNIAGMIEHLVKKHDLKLIAEEGAFGPVDTSVISAFPIRKVREDVSDYFVKQGEITGAEHYTILSGGAIHLEGIETPKLYTASQKAVRSFLNAESQGYVYDLRDMLDELKAEIYHPRLLKFDKTRMAYRQGDIDLLKYSAYLLRTVRRLDLKVSDYPEVSRFLSIKQSFFSVGIDQDQFFRELDKIDKDVRQGLYTTNTQQEFDGLYARLDIIERLLNISVTPEELQTFRTQREKYTTQAFINFVGAIRESPNGMDYIENDIYVLDEYLKQVEQFYRLADERSRHFVDNLLRKMDELDENLAVMVNGGFHTEKVLAELKNRNVTYISVKPRVSQQDVVNPYFELLQGRETPLEKLLAKNQTIMAVLTGFFKHAARVKFSIPVEAIAQRLKHEGRLTQKRLNALETFVKSNLIVEVNDARPETLSGIPQLDNGEIYSAKLQTEDGEFIEVPLIRVDNSRLTNKLRKRLSGKATSIMTIGEEDIILLPSFAVEEIVVVVQIIAESQAKLDRYWRGVNLAPYIEKPFEMLAQFISDPIDYLFIKHEFGWGKAILRVVGLLVIFATLPALVLTFAWALGLLDGHAVIALIGIIVVAVKSSLQEQVIAFYEQSVIQMHAWWNRQVPWAQLQEKDSGPEISLEASVSESDPLLEADRYTILSLSQISDSEILKQFANFDFSINMPSDQDRGFVKDMEDARREIMRLPPSQRKNCLVAIEKGKISACILFNPAADHKFVYANGIFVAGPRITGIARKLYNEAFRYLHSQGYQIYNIDVLDNPVANEFHEAQVKYFRSRFALASEPSRDSKGRLTSYWIDMEKAIEPATSTSRIKGSLAQLCRISGEDEKAVNSSLRSIMKLEFINESTLPVVLDQIVDSVTGAEPKQVLPILRAIGKIYRNLKYNLPANISAQAIAQIAERLNKLAHSSTSDQVDMIFLTTAEILTAFNPLEEIEGMASNERMKLETYLQILDQIANVAEKAGPLASVAALKTLVPMMHYFMWPVTLEEEEIQGKNLDEILIRKLATIADLFEELRVKSSEPLDTVVAMAAIRETIEDNVTFYREQEPEIVVGNILKQISKNGPMAINAILTAKPELTKVPFEASAPMRSGRIMSYVFQSLPLLKAPTDHGIKPMPDAVSPLDLVKINLSQLALKAGIQTTLIFEKAESRGFVFKTADGRRLVIKISIEGENNGLLQREALGFIWGQEHTGNLLPPKPVKITPNEFRFRFAWDQLTPEMQTKMNRALEKSSHDAYESTGYPLKIDRKFYTAIAYVVEQDSKYIGHLDFKYVKKWDDFKKSTLRSVRTLGQWARKGVIHSSLASMYHDFGSEIRPYVVTSGLNKILDYSVGHIRAWREAVWGINIAPEGKTRDFKRVMPINETSKNAVFTNSQLAFIRNQFPGREQNIFFLESLCRYALILTLNAGAWQDNNNWEGLDWQKRKTLKDLAIFMRQIYITLGREYLGLSNQEQILRWTKTINWIRYARQMRFWMDPYTYWGFVKPPEINEIDTRLKDFPAKQLFGLAPEKIKFGEFLKKTYNDKDGFIGSVGRQHNKRSIGSWNGTTFLIENARASFIIFGLAIARQALEQQAQKVKNMHQTAQPKKTASWMTVPDTISAKDNPPGAIKWLAYKLGLDAVGTGRFEGASLASLYLLFTSILLAHAPPLLNSSLDMGIYLIAPIFVLYIPMYLGHVFGGVVGVGFENKTFFEKIKLSFKPTYKAIFTSLFFPVIVMLILSFGLVAPLWLTIFSLMAILISREWHGEANKDVKLSVVNLADLEAQYKKSPNDLRYQSLIGQEFSRYQADHSEKGAETKKSKRKNILFGPNFELGNVVFETSPILSVKFRPEKGATDSPLNADFFEQKVEVVLAMPNWARKMVLNDNTGILPSIGRGIIRLWLRSALWGTFQLRRLRFSIISLGMNRKNTLVKHILEMMTEDVKPLETSIRQKAGRQVTIGLNVFLTLCSPILPLADVSALESQFNPATEQQVRTMSQRTEALGKYQHLLQYRDNGAVNSLAESQTGSLAQLLAMETGAVSKQMKSMAEQALSAALAQPGNLDLLQDYNLDEVESIAIAAFPELAKALVEQVTLNDIKVDAGLLAILEKMAEITVPGETIVMAKTEVESLLQSSKTQGARAESTQAMALGQDYFGKCVYAIASTREINEFTFEKDGVETTYYLPVVGKVTDKDGQSKERVIEKVKAGTISVHRFKGRLLANPADRTAEFNTWQRLLLIFGGPRVHQNIAQKASSAYFNQIMEKLNQLMSAQTVAPVIQVLENPGSDLQRMLMAVFAAKDEKSALRAQTQFARHLNAMVTNYYKLFQEAYSEDNLDLFAENMLNLKALTHLSELLNPIMVVEKNYAAPEAYGTLSPLIAGLQKRGIKQESLSVPFGLLGLYGSRGALQDMVEQHNYVVRDDLQFIRRAIMLFGGAA